MTLPPQTTHPDAFVYEPDTLADAFVLEAAVSTIDDAWTPDDGGDDD